MKKNLEKLVYMVLGAALALSGYMFGTLNSGNVDAQVQPAVMDKIVCKQLEVVNSRGQTIAVIGEEARVLGTSVLRVYDGVRQFPVIDLLYNNVDGGYLRVVDNDGKAGVVLRNDTKGGTVGVFGKGGIYGILLGNDADGGTVEILGKDGKSAVVLNIDEAGGRVDVLDKGGRKGVFLANNAVGGAVGVRGKDGKSGVMLGVERNTGRVVVFDRFANPIGSVP